MLTIGLAILAVLGIVAVVIVTVVPAMLVRAWALTKLWAWFVVPISNLPQIGYAQAIGISMLLGMLTAHYTPHEDKCTEKEKAISYISYAFLYPLLTVCIAWCVKYFGSL